MTTIEERSRALLDSLHGASVDDLTSWVRHHNAAYWDNAAPEVDDEAYDKLVEALRQRAPDHPILDELGESRRPGEIGSEVQHRTPMLSLDKCYDDETLAKWREKVPGALTCTPKIDGVACTFRYDARGQLALAATRGDGRVGDDITQNVLRIDDIPTRVVPETIADHLDEDGFVEVRGEVFLRISRFKEFFSKEASNPRNLCAGAIKRKDADESARYGLSFFAYDVAAAGLSSERDKWALLDRLGIPRPEGSMIEVDDDAASIFSRWATARDDHDFELDGVVYKVDDLARQRAMGVTAHHPRFAIAYKFQSASAQTKLREVLWSVARSGVITPVAVMDPVALAGVTVRRASLHNVGFIEKLGLTEDALVEVTRRGDVIPKVERVLAAGGEPITVPKQCPSCGGDVVLEGDFLYCAKPERCGDVLKGKILHYCKVVDVKGFGDRIVSALLERDLLRAPADLYRLTVEQLEALDRLGRTSATNLVESMNTKRNLTLPVFLTALGVDEVGLTVAETLADEYTTLTALRGVDEEQLANLHGVGPRIAEAVVAGLSERHDEIDDLLLEVEIVEAEKTGDESSPVFAKKVVFTGKMAKTDRKTAQKSVQALGGKTPSSVTADLDILVVGDDGSPLLGDGKLSTKHKKAESLNAKGAEIRIMSEGDFFALLEGAEQQEER